MIKKITDIKFAILAVDIVVFKMEKDELNVLLVESQNPVYTGKNALIGGLVEPEESLEKAAKRYFDTFVDTPQNSYHLEQLYTFGDPDRDPSGRVVTVAYYALVPPEALTKRTKRYKNVRWYPVKDLQELAYDHKALVETAVERLRTKLEYTNIIFGLMPESFTLTELQQTYEKILGRSLDKRNFRKKLKQLGLVKKLPHKRKGIPMRPAQLFTFADRKPVNVEVL